MPHTWYRSRGVYRAPQHLNTVSLQPCQLHPRTPSRGNNSGVGGLLQGVEGLVPAVRREDLPRSRAQSQSTGRTFQKCLSGHSGRGSGIVPGVMTWGPREECGPLAAVPRTVAQNSNCCPLQFSLMILTDGQPSIPGLAQPWVPPCLE